MTYVHIFQPFFEPATRGQVNPFFGSVGGSTEAVEVLDHIDLSVAILAQGSRLKAQVSCESNVEFAVSLVG